MSEKSKVNQDKNSLLATYEFFSNGWKTLVGFSVIGLSAGIIATFVLPERYEASALIKPATVGSGVVDNKPWMTEPQPVETMAVLSEKMRAPSYYSPQTIEACGLSGNIRASKTLAERLRPTVVRGSTFVAVSYYSRSPEDAAKCLQFVLSDVVQNQAQLARPIIDNLEVALRNADLELQATIAERDLQLVTKARNLEVAKLKLADAKEFLDQISKNHAPFKIDDGQFSESARLFSTMLEKQNEIRELNRNINLLEFEIPANAMAVQQRVRSLTNQVTELKNALSPAATSPASFAVPIYAPGVRSSPQLGLLVASGLIGGFGLGVIVLVFARVRRTLSKRR